MAKVVDFYQKLRDGKYEKYNLNTKKIIEIGDAIGIDWNEVDLGEFAQGVKEELEHGDMFAIDPSDTNVTNDDVNMTAKIAWAHLKEVPDYYTRLEALETEGEEHWEKSDFHDWIKENKEKHADVWDAAK